VSISGAKDVHGVGPAMASNFELRHSATIVWDVVLKGVATHALCLCPLEVVNGFGMQNDSKDYLFRKAYFPTKIKKVH
jgi:hypothetical protein